MIDSAALLRNLKVQLKALRDDLRDRAEDRESPWGARLRAEHAEALRRGRTGRTWTPWRDDEVDQAAVGWLVATTFLRFCEDNDLLAGARIDGQSVPVGWIVAPVDDAATGTDRVARAEENITAYFRANPTHNRRHWIQEGLRVLAVQPAGRALVDPGHHPVWTAEISPEAAADLLAFWRRTDDAGALVHDFRDPELGTRFLGDLYQDLSDHAKKTYALLQTPEFVEEFILDRTLTPALAELGLEPVNKDGSKGLRLIDPTCGSGHFLLGAFRRVLEAWEEHAPGLDAKERVRRAMDAIHGVDLNPFAVAIARFRLTVAGLRATDETSLVGVPAMGFHLAIGDSLLGGEQGTQGTTDEFFEDQLDLGDTLGSAVADGPLVVEPETTFQYGAEDLAEHHDILNPGRYHVVVGNPPYITVKDKALNTAYRAAYATASGKYALSVPFMELFFRLAVKGEQGVAAGHVGQITANSFMKREFGRTLIEDLFGGRNPELWRENPVDLTAVIDTSGAYIPGHGTPTVIIVGRRRDAVASTVRAVLGVRGEPGQPEDPAEGRVWIEITGHIDAPGHDGVYVSVSDLDRSILASFPWSLSGGGASDLKSLMENSSHGTVGDASDSLGITSFTLEDEVFVRPSRALARYGVTYVRPMVLGDSLRDWINDGDDTAIFPYDGDFAPIEADANRRIRGVMWPYRANLANSLMFGGRTKTEDGLKWFEFGRLTASKLRVPMSIAFAFVATHNHFVLDRGGKVFNRSAPVIKLPEGASEEQHLELLGVLNSSTACFWLKQVSQDKGNRGGERSTAMETWDHFFEFTGTKLQEFPLPESLPLERARTLDGLAQKLSASSPLSTIAEVLTDDPTVSGDRGYLAHRLEQAEQESERLRARMIFEQEELDWEVYRLYGLLDEDLTVGLDGLGRREDELALGERAFEIVLARRIAEGEEESAWFERHGSTPITELPEQWSADYRKLVQRRLDVIASDRSIRLLEQPEHKRRWSSVPWQKQRDEALRAALLDRLENAEFWQDGQGPAARSVLELADLVRHDAIVQELARCLSGQNEGVDLVTVIASLASEEAVPYLAAHRYKPSGLEKFREWQKTWDLQRREDVGEKVAIPVPSKYATADFRKPAYWKARGKLDVPKERFVLYPDVRREGDSTPVLGWAGWSHRDQALALARETHGQLAQGATDEALVPLIAGLIELEPWLHQWHADIEPDFGASAADVITQEIDGHLARLSMTRDQVTAWMPAAAKRGRKAAAR